MLIDPAEQFQGKVLIVAPHMDDEILACGGLMARLPDKSRVYAVYATDGMKSPAPVIPGRDRITPDLGELRVREAEAAMGVIGVARENLHFLRLPEAQLRRHVPDLERLLLEVIGEISPDHVIVPFRYDRHPDHLAINQVVTRACLDGRCSARLTEYFVYYRWRLLPRRDIRRYVKPEYLLEVDISEVARQKRASLACFKTQTTRFYEWQTRPILTPTLLDEECVGPEVFLRFDPAARGATVFTDMVPWIRVVHRLEPRLQKWKYLVKSSVLRSLGRNAT
jgi:LmbE family N-acetylglucosaminyl deacetylase